MSTRRAGTTVALVVVLVTLGALLAGWAASIGPAGVLEGDGLEPVRVTPSPTATASPGGEGSDESELRPEDVETHPWVGRVLLGLLLAGAAGGLALVVRAVVRALRRRDRRAVDAPVPVGSGELLRARALADGLRADAADQQALLDAGEPRDAIVACWHRFEVRAAAAGAGREVWETPAEHVARVLGTVGADPVATHRLADLYREARFSTHPLGEVHRAAAAAALAAVHDSLGRTADRSEPAR